MKAQMDIIGIADTVGICIKKTDALCLNPLPQFYHHCKMVWVEEGCGQIIVGDSINAFKGGDLIFMGPCLSHIFQNDTQFSKSNEFRTRATIIYFPPDYLFNLSNEDSVTLPARELIKRSGRGLKFFGETQKQITGMLSDISEKDGLKKILQVLSVIDILSHSNEYGFLASDQFKKIVDDKDSKRLDTAFRFMLQNYQRNISLSELANVCYMAPTAFCRFFKSHTRKSVFRFLNELRIENACKLLQNDYYSIADACFESGYNNLANFNRFFKIVKGLTPSEYRKQLNRYSASVA